MMGSQNSTMNLNLNPNGAAATAKTETFSESIRLRLSRKFEEFKSRKNVNKLEEERLLHDGAVQDFQCIEECKDFQDQKRLKGIEKNIKEKEKNGEIQKENYRYDTINVKDEDVENNKYCNKTSILLDCTSPSFKIYCIEIDKEKDDDNDNNNDEEEEQKKFNDEEETVELLQHPAKTSIDDESADESIESASSASENSNTQVPVEMEPLTTTTSKKKRLGKIKFANMKNLNVKNIKNRIINPLLSGAQDRKLFILSPK